MKLIPLTQNKFAIVDDTDYDWLNQWKWFSLNKKYAAKMDKRNMILMHRFIMNVDKPKEIDHIDFNGFNNQRFNLRICSHSENIYHTRRFKNNTSGYKGVRLFNYDGREKQWQAYICPKNKFIHIGYFSTKEEAAIAYNEMAIKYYKKYSQLNKI